MQLIVQLHYRTMPEVKNYEQQHNHKQSISSYTTDTQDTSIWFPARRQDIAKIYSLYRIQIMGITATL